MATPERACRFFRSCIRFTPRLGGCCLQLTPGSVRTCARAMASPSPSVCHAVITYPLFNVDPPAYPHPFFPPPLRMFLVKRKLHESKRAAQSCSSSDLPILPQGRLAHSTPGVAPSRRALRRRHHAFCRRFRICQAAEPYHCTHADQCARTQSLWCLLFVLLCRPPNSQQPEF